MLCEFSPPKLRVEMKPVFRQVTEFDWAVLSDEQMRKIWPFSLLIDEQMSNKVGVKHQPADNTCFFY